MKSTDFVNDFQFLINEITGSEDGVGEDLSFSSIYDELKDARVEEDDELSLGIWERKLKKADWKKVLTLSKNILENKSKDLQVVFWLIEGIATVDGVDSFPKCLDILRDFLESFWYTCYPKSNDQKARALELTINKLNEKLVISKFISGISLYDYEYSLTIRNLIKKTPSEEAQILRSAASSNKKTLHEINSILKNTDKTLIESVLYCVQNIKNSALLLSDTVKKISEGGESIVSFATFMGNLEKIERLLKSTQSKSAYPGDPSEGEKPTEQLNEQIAGEIVETSLQRRDMTYAKLREALKELQILEKHGPIPFILELIISWKDKNLFEIMDDSSRGDTEAHKLLRIMFYK
jgi:type VI secretion system protein ImpA